MPPVAPDRPPFLGTWNRIYLVVLVNLTLWIAALCFVTAWFRPTP